MQTVCTWTHNFRNGVMRYCIHVLNCAIYCTLHSRVLTGCSLITHDCRFDFSSQTQSFMKTLSNFTIKVTQVCLLLLAAFPKLTGKPPWPYWRLGQPWVGCVWLYSFIVLILLNNDLCCEFAFILSGLNSEWPITWSGSALSLPDNFFMLNPCPPTAPASTHCSAHLIQSTSVKRLSKIAETWLLITWWSWR